MENRLRTPKFPPIPSNVVLTITSCPTLSALMPPTPKKLKLCLLAKVQLCRSAMSQRGSCSALASSPFRNDTCVSSTMLSLASSLAPTSRAAPSVAEDVVYLHRCALVSALRHRALDVRCCLPVKDAVAESCNACVRRDAHAYQRWRKINVGVAVLKGNSCGNGEKGSSAARRELYAALPDIFTVAVPPESVKTAKDCVFSPFQNTLSEPLPCKTALTSFSATERPVYIKREGLFGCNKPRKVAPQLKGRAIDPRLPWLALPS